MSCQSGADIVNDSLVLSIDANNRKSYIDAIPDQSKINTASWTLGTGGVAGYGNNGLTAESQRIVDTDPWGNQSLVWGTYPTGDSGADGGWEGSHFSIDNTKLYRSSVWTRRTSATYSGTSYMGLHTNGTGDTYHLNAGESQTNPYWDYVGLGGFTQNLWYLVVGHIFPHTHTGTTAHTNSGIYLAGSTTKISPLRGNVPQDVKFPSNATTAMQRVYHYYCADTTSRLQFAYPRWDLIDGNEPSLSDLLFDSSGIAYNTASTTTNAKCVGKVPPLILDGTVKCFDFSANVGLNHSTAISGFVFSPNPVPTTGSFTFNTWVKNVPATVSQQGFFTNTGSGNGYRFGIGADGIYWLIGPTYQEGQLGYGTALVNTQWNNICVLFDRSGTITPGTPKIYMYVNGILSNSVAIAASQTAFPSDPAYMAKGGWTFPSFSGKLGKFDVYSKALTATEVMQNFNASRSRFGL